MPLCYSVLGDLYPPAQRSKWVGLLNIPQGIFALIGPTLGGWMVDHYSWRHLYWMGVPLLVFCLIMVPISIPPPAKKVLRKIDVRGAVLVAIASSLTIIGISFAGTTYPWASVQIIGLLGGALLFWVLFFRAETEADDPILDPQVFRNRTFLTVALSGMMSFFGLMAMMMYFPIFLQGVQGITVMRSGQILTPFNVLMAFIGVPTGFILAKTKRYKWMYISGYGLLTAVIFGIAFFDASTPVLLRSYRGDARRPGAWHDPYGEHARRSVCGPQKASGRGDGGDIFQHHDGNGDFPGHPGDGNEYFLCQNPGDSAALGIAPVRGQGDDGLPG